MYGRYNNSYWDENVGRAYHRVIMNEKIPSREYDPEKMKASIDEGLRRVEEDKADPVRGPVMRMAHIVHEAAVRKFGQSLWNDFQIVQSSFPRQFTNPEERKRYRLYHYIIGGTPDDTVDLFDTEGPASIEAGLRALAEKYHIDTSAA